MACVHERVHVVSSIHLSYSSTPWKDLLVLYTITMMYIDLYCSYNLQHTEKYLQKWKYLST